MFTKTLGTLDRIFRIVLGTGMITFGIINLGTLGIVLLVVGFVPLVTGLVGNCPLYSVGKINTVSHSGKSCSWQGGS